MADSPDELGVLGKEIDGRYRLDRFVGSGTMGAVYEGVQIAVGRRVAVKLVNATLQSQKEVRERFRVEAQAIATLSHSNCVTLYDFGYAEELGTLYMAMEYLDGQSLDCLILQGLPATTALSLAKQIADVLVVAHEKGIMHRDLKPENVMVVADEEARPHAKVLDFGLARIFEDASGGTRLTRHGQLFGTPAYMSPEQCKSAMDVGPPADVYALGVSMFEMLMGRLPFDSPSVPELLVLHSTKTAPPVAVDDVPLEVNALVARMMEKDQARRPTAREVSEILDAALQGRPIPALPPYPRQGSIRGADAEIANQATIALSPPSAELTDPTSTGIPIVPRRNVGAAAVVATVAAVALLVLAAVMLTDGDPPDATAAAVPSTVEKQQPTSIAPPSTEPVDEAEPPGAAEDLAVDKGALVASELANAATALAQTQGAAKKKSAERAENTTARKSKLRDHLKEVRKRRKARRLRSLGGKDLYE